MEAPNQASESSFHLRSGDDYLLGPWLQGTYIRDCKDSMHFSRADAATADMALLAGWRPAMANPRSLAAIASVPRYVWRCAKRLMGGSAEQRGLSARFGF